MCFQKKEFCLDKDLFWSLGPVQIAVQKKRRMGPE
uniref:Uncharacterized protein MANES_01G215400 n=1 Tax=Rhizophora mucronata TaxID=61149 RepID=A0A2P2N6T4_RHIMU